MRNRTENENELEIDLSNPETIAQLRAALGLDKIDAALNILGVNFEQLLAYTNQVDSRIRNVMGEATVTETIKPILSLESGKLTIHREVLSKIPGSITIPQ